jgi:hypothetical protein
MCASGKVNLPEGKTCRDAQNCTVVSGAVEVEFGENQIDKTKADQKNKLKINN